MPLNVQIGVLHVKYVLHQLKCFGGKTVWFVTLLGVSVAAEGLHAVYV